MPFEQLENLVRSGQLERESPDEREIAGLIRSAEERLRDARAHCRSSSQSMARPRDGTHEEEQRRIRRIGGD
jgi:hypothetical protein